ncbi:PAS domain-containing hybrid sensor histidine kinase/response regulator [Alteromonas flava]|uniref:PAS domain-containing hybrid sensor histidine kinase/response regulator n=1 Tax=Alteromonas flava TaxID=2048003 RepID=UPI000C28484C|nr:PAS domain-containing hybrid sensor histidine kinase/response regulator [Alteromonas flava]
MFNFWTVTAVIIAYLIALFAVAFWSDRRQREHQQHPYVYSLALGVHCTSWAFFGTTTQASNYGWAFIPTYLGMIIVFVIGFSLVKKLANYCQSQQISSLADFIGARYNSRFSLAALVTIISFIGVIPYIALQLDAITLALALISNESPATTSGIGLYVAALMALFAILFGTRTLSLTEKHPGLMTTIAFESILKLAGITAVGIYVCFFLFDGPLDLIGQAANHPQASEVIYADSAIGVFLCHVLLGICAAFCLPRQFHITFVENNGDDELRTARWMFPLYLSLMTLFILPIALAGHILLDGSGYSTDSFALAIPIAQNQATVSLIAFIGGISAATSMVIVATLALGIMISNSLVTPLWLRFTLSSRSKQSLAPSRILAIRRITVLVVLSVAYAYHLYISQSAPLVQSGTIAMALLAQLVPALLLPFFWQKSNALSAWMGILVGSCCWFVTMLWPAITSTYYFAAPPTDAALGNSVVLSLLLNLLTYWLFALRPSAGITDTPADQQLLPSLVIPIADLRHLLQRILPDPDFTQFAQQVKDHSTQAIASAPLVMHCERLLASQVGLAGARILLSTVASKQNSSITERVELAEQASQTLQFNHEVLQSSVQHIEQGISVLDRELNMLAWNQRYLELFDYPSDFISVGKPIESVLRANAERGMFGEVSDIEAEISKRISYMRSGSRYKYIRKQPDDRTIEINGSPLPGGGYVTTYSDISEYIRIQDELTDAKKGLEQRVLERTGELEKARLAADQANRSKTKFLAAAGHDLMQPFNAAVLYASMLTQRVNTPTSQQQLREISDGIVQSLSSAESLLHTLLDMTKLESGVLQPNVSEFMLDDLFASLCQEFTVIAAQKGVMLRYVKTQRSVVSDKKLLRRILQNLLSNAIRYARDSERPRVVFGARKHGSEQLKLIVADNGLGIDKQHQQIIFAEFHQLTQTESHQGLGLGLTIVERMASLLNHEIGLNSEPNVGSMFSVTVQRGQSVKSVPALLSVKNAVEAHSEQFLAGQRVLLVENDPQIQKAIAHLLTDWGATVSVAESGKQVSQVAIEAPDLLIVDYHLNAGETGIDVITHASARWQRHVPGVLTTANRDDNVKDQALNVGLTFLPKPVKPMALKRLLKNLLV